MHDHNGSNDVDHSGDLNKVLLIGNPNVGKSALFGLLTGKYVTVSNYPGTTVEVLTAPFGVAYIETRFEALIGAYAVAQLAAEHHARFDAVIVAASRSWKGRSHERKIGPTASLPCR